MVYMSNPTQQYMIIGHKINWYGKPYIAASLI